MNNVVLRRFGFLLMVPCGEKHVGILNVILYYKYLRNKFLLLLVCYRQSLINNARNEQ